MALATRYPGQIIAIFSDDLFTRNNAKHLLDKNPEGTQVVIWEPNDARDPSQGGQFKLAEWMLLDFGEPLTPAPIVRLPHGGRIQVIGHGGLDTETNTMSIEGLDASQVASALKSLPTDGTPGAIKRVSLINCELGALKPDGTGFAADEFPEILLRDMRDTVEEVSARTGLVCIDSTRRKVSGGMTLEGRVVWTAKVGSITKTVIRHDDTGDVIRIQQNIHQDPATFPKPSTLPKFVEPTGGSIELEETGAAADPKYVTLNNDDLFNVISSVAEKHFQTVSKHLIRDSRVENERLVRVLDREGVTNDRIIKIREFSSYAELTQEIKLWGEKGFEFPSYDENTNTWTTTDSTGEPFANKYMYYRYGDFVYSVKVQSDLQARGTPGILNHFTQL